MGISCSLNMRIILYILFLFILSDKKGPVYAVSPTQQPTMRPTTITAISDPMVVSFTFDAGTGGLALTFDQLIVASAFDSSKIAIQGTRNRTKGANLALFYTPFNNLADQLNTTVFQFYPTTDDYAKITIFPDVATAVDNTFLTMARGTVKAAGTMADNKEINITHGLKVTTFFPDKIPPEFRAFSLDMNRCILNITFNEPIAPSTLVLYGIAIQSQANVFSTGYYVQFQTAGASVINVWNFQRSVSVSLGQTNCDILRAPDGLAGSVDETYLSIFAPFVNDTSGNLLNIIGVDNYNAKQVGNFVEDTTSSKLLKWTLDLGPGCINLYFDEAMKALSLNASRIILLNGPSYAASTQILRIQTPSSTTRINSALITICLNEDQGNYVKINRNIGTTVNDSYIIIEPNAICDNANNENWYLGSDATNAKTKQAFAFFPDTLPPDIKSMSIDLTNKNLTIVFTKPCVLDKLSFTGLSFQSKQVADASAEIVSMDAIKAIKLSTGNSTTFRMKLTDSGFNALKSGNLIAKSKGSIFATNSILFVKDTSSNAIVAHLPASGISLSSYFPDTVSPSLISWSMDMTLNEITFVFSEPVNITTFNASAIFISSDAIPMISSKNITLNILSSVSYVPSTASTTVTLKLYSLDIVAIKSSNVLCSLNTSCWLSFSQYLCTDTLTISSEGKVYANPIIAKANLASLKFTPDLQGPKITSFSVDVDQGMLKLFFDKPINTNNMFINNTLLSSSIDFETNVTSLNANDDVSVSNYVMVTIGFLQSDLNKVKEKRICSSNSTCFISLSSNYSFFDYYGNVFAGFIDKTGKRVTVLSSIMVTSNTIPPALTAFFYDRSNALLNLHFNEPVLQSLFNPGTFNLINNAGTSVSFGRAIQIVSTSSNVIILNVQPVTPQMTAASIGQNQDATTAYMTANGVQDFFQLKNLATSATTAIREGNVVLFFRFNMAVGYVAFEFGAPLDIGSLDVTKISLSASSGSVSLSNYTRYTMPTTTLLRVYLTMSDYVNIQTNMRISSKDDIRVMVVSDFIIDSKSRQLSSTVSLPCKFFTADDIPPALVNYDLNLGTGILDLYFSEAVVSAGLSFDYVYLASSNSTNAVTISLKGAKVITTMERSSYISVSLNEGDYPTVRDKIHLSSGLCRNTLTTNIYFSSSFVFDTASPPNFIAGVSHASAKPVRTLVADRITPNLIMYSIDLSKRQIYLMFDEVVNASRNNPSNYVLGQSNVDGSSTRYTLASSKTNTSASIGAQVTITISTADYIEIMKLAPNLCLTADSCFLSLRAGAITDIAPSPNQIKDVFYRYGMKPMVYSPDTTGPKLLKFDFSLQESWFDLYYDKVINCNMFDLTKFTFQYALFTSSYPEKVTLDSDCKATCQIQYNTSFRINIGATTLLDMKVFDYLLKDPLYSYLRIDIGGTVDPFGNKQIAINDGFAMQVNSYYADTTRPRFLSYTILSQKTLILTFNKPMNVTSAKITQVTFQNQTTRGYVEFDLTDASTLLAIDPYKRIFTYSIINDYNTITQNSNIFSKQISTYLRLTAAMIKDTSGNMVQAILPDDALPLGPSISSWNIDMNYGDFSLYFSEDVVPPFLRVSDSIFVRLQSQPSLQPSQQPSLRPSLQLPNQPSLINTNPTSQPSSQPSRQPSLQPSSQPSRQPSSQPSSQPSFQPSSQPSLQPSSQPSLQPSSQPSLQPSSQPSCQPSSQPTNPTGQPSSQPTMQPSYTTNPTGQPSFQPSSRPSSQPSMKPSSQPSSQPTNPTGQPSSQPTMQPSLQPSLQPSSQPSLQPSSQPSSRPSLQPSSQGSEGVNYVNLKTSQKMTRDTTTYNSSHFVIKLSSNDINMLKYNRVASSVTTSYLTVSFGLTKSLFSGTIIPFLQTIEIPIRNGLRVSAYVPDTTKPNCTGFDLNLNLGQVSIMFNEPVLSSSIALTSLSLLSSKGATAKIREVQRNVILFQLTTIVITINTYDLNLIKIANKESQLSSLLIASGAAEDYFGNKMVGNTEKNPVLLRTYTADTIAPIVTGFILDLQRGLLSLNFSEVIDIATFPLTSIKILSSGSIAATVQLTLTRYSLVSMTSDFTVQIDMSTYNTDIAALNSLDDIGTSVSNTYLSYAGVYDIVGNFNNTPKYIQASSLIIDTIQPSLLSFDFETSGSNKAITLYFSKAINIDTFSCVSFTFLNSNTASATAYTPAASNCTMVTTVASAGSHYSSKISYTIPSSSFVTIGATADSTWIQVTSSQTNKDTYNNALSTSTTVFRRVGPQLTKYYVDMNLGTIVLVFSKPIGLSSNFNASKLSIYSAVSRQQTFLTGTLYTGMDKIFSDSSDPDYFGKVVVAASDLDNLKILDLKPNTFFIGVSLGMAKDSLGKDVNAISPQSMIKAVKFVTDVTRPNLLRMVVDMGSETILLQFDEPIQASSVRVSLLVIQSTISSSINSFQLTSANAQTSGRNLTINLIATDAGVLKTKAGLAKSTSTTFLSFGFQAMADFAGNYLSTQPSTAAFAANNFLPDKKNPVLISFNVDMNVGSIVFTFSEPVLARTFNPMSIVIQSRFLRADGTFLAITGGQVSAADGFVITLTLLSTDLFNIKNTIGLCRTRQSAYIVINSGLVVDTSFNNVTAIVDGLALPCSFLAADTIPPTIQSVTLDANKGHVIFSMSEIIQLPTVDVTKLTLLAGSNPSTKIKYTLTAVSSVAPYTHPYTSTLVVVIGPSDLNSIRSQAALITSATNSWYAIIKTFVQDTFGNGLATDVLLPTSTYYPDVTNPLITNIAVDMSSLVITLQFTKAVNMNRFTDTEYFIHNNKIKRYGNVSTLIGSTYEAGRGGDSGRIRVTISSTNSKILKYNFICQTAITCFQSWSNNFAFDNAGNYLPAQWDASISGYAPIQPGFAPDSIEPVLYKWFFDRTEMQFNLFFDEPVTLQNSSQIVVYFDNIMTQATKVVLRNVVTTYLDYNSQVILAFPKVCPASESASDCTRDLNSLKLLSSSSPQSLYMTTGATAFSDLALIPNNLKDKSLVPTQESGPECGLCPSGSYISQQCTNNADRVCTRCSSCNTGKFALSQCSAYSDTQCELCSTCSDGLYIKQQCSATSDTKCDVCTKCDSLSYETRNCEFGLNTVCATCRSCSLNSAKAVAVCNAGSYFSWALTNCCFDSSGQQQVCNEVTLANVAITARNGRHHWAFSKTVPPVIGYDIGANF